MIKTCDLKCKTVPYSKQGISLLKLFKLEIFCMTLLNRHFNNYFYHMMLEGSLLATDPWSQAILLIYSLLNLQVSNTNDNFHMASVSPVGQAEAADGNVVASF